MVFNLPRRNVTIRVPAEIVVGQVSQVLDLLVVEDERQLRGVPGKAGVATFASKGRFNKKIELKSWPCT
jgi:hypothetical protein